MERFDVMLVPVRGLLLEIGNFLPRLGVALAVLIVGWLLAKGFRIAVVKALRALNFHILTERAGIDGFLKQGGTDKDTTEWIGALGYALVLIASLIIAFNSLGLTQVTDLLGKVLLFVPRVLVALLVVVFGSYFSRFVSNAIQRSFRAAGIRDRGRDRRAHDVRGRLHIGEGGQRPVERPVRTDRVRLYLSRRLRAGRAGAPVRPALTRT